MDPVALAAPVLAEDAVTQVSVAVTWDAVENAASYACTLDGAAGTIVTQLSVRFDGLEPGRSYTVEVKAVAGQEQYLDSECARITLTTLPATQLAAPVLRRATPRRIPRQSCGKPFPMRHPMYIRSMAVRS